MLILVLTQLTSCKIYITLFYLATTFSICDLCKVKGLSCGEFMPALVSYLRDWFRETNLPGSALIFGLVDGALNLYTCRLGKERVWEERKETGRKRKSLEAKLLFL